MINLLPPSVKSNYRYAQRNVGLRLWLVVFVATFVGLAGIATYGLLTIQQSTAQYHKRVDTDQQLIKRADFTGTQKRVQDINSSFKLVVQVLEKEILFSELLKQVGATIPRGSSLTGLTINQVQGGLDVSAIAVDYPTATQVQVNLADPTNKIFTKADILGIDCSGSASPDPAYPCLITIRALFGNNNPFLLINNKAAKP